MNTSDTIFRVRFTHLLSEFMRWSCDIAMNMKWKEDLLFGPISEYFRTRGYRIYKEVQVAKRWVDVLAVGEDLVAIELKVRDWRTALRQAVSYQLGVNYALVAMPLDHVFPALKSRGLFEKEGVGLMAISTSVGDVRTLIEPQVSPRLMPFVRDGVLSDKNGQSGKPRRRRRIPSIKIPDFEQPIT